MSTLYHLTANTGHLRQSSRTEIAPDILAIMTEWLRGALDGPTYAPLPTAAVKGYHVRLTTRGDALLVTVFAPPLGSEFPLATFAVVASSAESAAMWHMLTGAPIHYRIAPGLACPPTPWCVVTLYNTIAAHPATAEWLGDFERCVAWAWLKLQNRTSVR